MHKTMNAFHVNSPNDAQPRILDLCVAPGGFLVAALEIHPRGQAVGFTLPKADGGKKLCLKNLKRVKKNLKRAKMEYLDITMLAADLGLDAVDIPPDHPDRDKFILERRLPAKLSPDPSQEEDKSEDKAEEKAVQKAEVEKKDAATQDGPFDLAICDGQVLRTQERAAYRAQREDHRLTAALLALSMGRLRPGGTLLVRLHRANAWDTAQMLWTMNRIADQIHTFKP